jgi:hypothetical protein
MMRKTFPEKNNWESVKIVKESRRNSLPKEKTTESKVMAAE